jgi:hypothetical protein
MHGEWLAFDFYPILTYKTARILRHGTPINIASSEERERSEKLTFFDRPFPQKLTRKL